MNEVKLKMERFRGWASSMEAAIDASSSSNLSLTELVQLGAAARESSKQNPSANDGKEEEAGKPVDWSKLDPYWDEIMNTYGIARLQVIAKYPDLPLELLSVIRQVGSSGKATGAAAGGQDDESDDDVDQSHSKDCGVILCLVFLYIIGGGLAGTGGFFLFLSSELNGNLNQRTIDSMHFLYGPNPSEDQIRAYCNSNFVWPDWCYCASDREFGTDLCFWSKLGIGLLVPGLFILLATLTVNLHLCRRDRECCWKRDSCCFCECCPAPPGAPDAAQESRD
jgi:hypothetical protein